MNQPNSTSGGTSRRPPYGRMAWVPPALLVLLAAGLVGAFVVPLAVDIHREMDRTAVDSYVRSVCRSVDEFHQQHGYDPQSLCEIDTSGLDYDLEIPLAELEYRIVDTGITVSYTMSDGYVVSCTGSSDPHAGDAGRPRGSEKQTRPSQSAKLCNRVVD